MAKNINCKVLVEATHKMTIDEWREHRKAGLGGSEAGSIAGVSKYSSPLKVYVDKLNLKEEAQEENEFMYWGNKLEDLVAEEFTKRILTEGIEFKIQKRNAILQHIDPDKYFMLANVDRLLYNKDLGWGILECKTTSEYGKNDWEDGEIPDYYYLQVQHYMAVLDVDYAYIAVLIGGNKFKHYRIDRDEEIINYLYKLESDFWNNHILTKTPPAPIGSEADNEAIKILSPVTTKEEIILDNSLDIILQELELVKHEEKELKERKERLEQTIKAAMGSHEIALLGDRKITWKTSVTNRFDTTTFKKDHKDLYQKYSKSSESRRFTI